MKNLNVGDKVWQGCYTSHGASSEGVYSIEEVGYRYHQETGTQYKVYRVGSSWYNESGCSLNEDSMYYLEEYKGRSECGECDCHNTTPRVYNIDSETKKIYDDFDWQTTFDMIFSEMEEEEEATIKTYQLKGMDLYAVANSKSEAAMIFRENRIGITENNLIETDIKADSNSFGKFFTSLRELENQNKN